MNATRTLINHPVPSAGKVRELALQEDVRTAEALTVRGGSLTPASALLHRAAPANKAAARHNCTSGPEWGVGGTHGLRAGRRPALLDTNPQMAVPGGRGQRNTRRREMDTRVGGWGAHTTKTHLHKKGSILISREEQGMVSSNLVITSG